MDDLDNARSALIRSLEIEPDQPAPYQGLANIDRANGDGVGFVSNYLLVMELDPQDHGYPARLANFLYGLGLQPEGDRFRARTLVIAPTSSHARRTELFQAVASGNGEVSYALAQQMLEDDVDLQSGAWQDALFVLFQEAEKQSASMSALEFAERVLPGFSDFSQPAPPKTMWARIAALPVFYSVESREEFSQRLVQLEQFLHGAAPSMQMQILALRGDTQAAIDVALTEILSEPAISFLEWINFISFDHRVFGLQFMAEVAADPRVQQALARWREERERAAEEVRHYVAGVEAK
jgi:hypothetical protein